jgi:hypothetical protein
MTVAVIRLGGVGMLVITKRDVQFTLKQLISLSAVWMANVVWMSYATMKFDNALRLSGGSLRKGVAIKSLHK